MTTDDKDNKSIDEKTIDEPTKEDISNPQKTDAPEPEMSATDKVLIDKMTDIFNTKLSETMDKYDKKIEQLNASIADKDKEIAKLRKVNSEILMSTDLRGNKKEEIDYNEVEFSEVDWDSEVKGMLDKIDKRIS